MADSKITALTAHTALIDTDVLPVVDITAVATKKTTWANIKSVLKTYFDTLYPSGSGTSTGTNTGDNTVATALTGTPSITVATVTTTGNIELGHATDTTLSRVSAGVLAVEGVTVATSSNTLTFTNKRNTLRTVTVNAPGATPTTNTDNQDVAVFTGLNAAITSMTTNLSGTPVANDLLEFIFVDDGTGRAITWGASFASSTVALPVITVASTPLRVLVQYQTIASLNKWVCIASV